MALDAPTLFVASGLCSVALSILLLLSWTQDRQTTALYWWSATFAISAVGLAVYATGETYDSFGREAGNTIFLVSFGLGYAAACRFNGRTPSIAIMAAGPLAWVLAISTVDLSFAARVVYTSILLGGYASVTTWVLWRGEALLFQRMAAIAGTIQTLFFLGRMASGPSIVINGDDTLGGVWASVVGACTLLYVCGYGFTVMAMTKERTDRANRRAALSDPLTGVGNRRGFLSAADRLVGQARGAPVALLLFDLDHFKAINDRHGHAIGDDVLVGFCDVLRAELPASAVIGRLGGEEFAVALTGEAAERAVAIAEAVRSRFARVWGMRGNLAIEATVSAGVAACAGCEATLMQLMSKADTALYRAKAAGRDTVLAAGPEPAAA
jgi:diguanylate cyclase (GGDEF)-like protein